MQEFPRLCESRLCKMSDSALSWVADAAVRSRARRKLDLYEACNAGDMEKKDRDRLLKRMDAQLRHGLEPDTPAPMTKEQRIAELVKAEGPIRLALGIKRSKGRK